MNRAGWPCRRKGRALWAILLGLSIVSLAGCAPEISTHGYRLNEALLDQIEPGRTSRDEVLALLGSPSSRTTFGDSIWYYVSQRTERMSFYQEEVVDQEVIAITFDDRDLVRSIDRRGLADARQIELVERETPTSGNELSVFEQFIGNIGRFNPTNQQGNR